MNLDIQTTGDVRVPSLPLEQLVERRRFTINPALEPAFLAEGRAQDNLRRLLDGALCVTSGQQPGLFTGPLYTVYKAVAASAAADCLASRLGEPVVPVYWVAGDDHDLAEANHVHLLTTDNTLRRVEVGVRQPDDPLTPLYRDQLGPDVHGAIEAILAETADTEFREAVVAWLRRHYGPEHDFAGAFAGAMAELLAPFGVVVFCPTHRAAKQAMAPQLVTALEQAAELDRRLGAHGATLRDRGGALPVPVGDGASLVMWEGPLGRDRLVLADGGFTARRAGVELTLADLQTLAQTDPQRLSPNVLLRPAVEATLLPTLAYVAGPGESAYWPETVPVFEALGVAPQAVLPRWSGRIVESRVAKVIDKYGITPEDLDRPEGQLEAQLVRDDMPEDAQDALQQLRRAIQHEYGRLEDAAFTIDPTLKKTVGHARNAAFKEVADVEKRLVGHLKKQNEIVMQQLAKARVNLYPLGKPQERVLNVVPYLIRYGWSLLERIHEAARRWYAPLGQRVPEH